MDPILVAVVSAAFFVVGTGILAMVVKCYKKIDQGKALIVNTLKSEPLVTFTGAVVIPIIHRSEVMDISLKTIEIDRRGKEGLICHDNIRADIKVAFFVRVNKTKDDVMKVAQAIGCARASDHKTLEELFVAKFSEALKTVGKRLDFVDLYQERDKFKDQIIEIIGKDLNGYMLEDAAIDYLEQTPIELLDKDNILDAQGIRKITELTTIQNVLTNDFRQNEIKAITKQNVEATEAILALERQKVDAETKQKREIETMRAREQAETAKVQSEEKLRSELARIKAEEEVAINEVNKQRQVDVAQKNRERVVLVETERVMKDQNLEAISREREVEVQRIDKEKVLEVERKNIADVVKLRIAVERGVAEEEERIKDVRLVSEAKRQREARLVNADADAQEKLVKDIKGAEAAQEVAKYQAKESVLRAEASLDAADKEARAKTRLAEGLQSEAAAVGLAQVKVKEADAIATEKLGMANVRVKEADAAAIQKVGLAEAAVTKEKMIAEAAGAEQQGLAQAKSREANAAAWLKEGEAEADRLAQKAEAMKAMAGVAREHEEFRLTLDKDKQVELEALKVKQSLGESQARVMAEAMSNAKINIVGGDGAFFDRFVKAVGMGQAVDGAIDNSAALQKFLGDYLSGNGSLTGDLKEVLSRPALGAGDLRDLSVATALAKALSMADGPMKAKIRKLLEETEKPVPGKSTTAST